MIDIILFGLGVGALIAIFSFLEATASDPENENIEMGNYVKTFIISALVSGLGIFVFKNISSDSPYSAQVEVGLLD